jgi:hypothetical protein
VPDGDARGVRKVLRYVLIATVVGAVAIQLVPYGRAHSNPPVAKEPAWDSPRTRTLAVGACFDCHSNETRWYWYTSIAPISWLVQHDVDEGRATLNLSRWDRPQEAAGEIVEVLAEGGMPPSYYGWAHASARLSAPERQALIDGFRRTLQASPPGA